MLTVNGNDYVNMYKIDLFSLLLFTSITYKRKFHLIATTAGLLHPFDQTLENKF